MKYPLSQEMKDYQFLEKNGHWPNGEFPEWLKEWKDQSLWQIMALQKSHEAEIEALKAFAESKEVVNDSDDIDWKTAFHEIIMAFGVTLKYQKVQKKNMIIWAEALAMNATVGPVDRRDTITLAATIKNLWKKLDLIPKEGY